MLTLMHDDGAWRREFEVLFPVTRWDSLPTVLYRADGKPALPPDNEPLPRWLIALTVRTSMPRWRGHDRRRWVAWAEADSPMALRRRPHERHGLVRALALARYSGGGFVAPSLRDFGDEEDQAAVLKVLKDEVGMLDHTSHRQPGSFQVGVSYADAFAEVMSTLDKAARKQAWAKARMLHEAVNVDFAGPCWDDVKIVVPPAQLAKGENPLATSSGVVADLTCAAAAQFIETLSARGLKRQDIADRLNLLGYINISGHRAWNAEYVRRVLARRTSDV